MIFSDIVIVVCWRGMLRCVFKVAMLMKALVVVSMVRVIVDEEGGEECHVVALE